MQRLTTQGIRDAEGWQFLDEKRSRATFVSRWRGVNQQIRNISRALGERQARGDTLPANGIWLLENGRLLQTLSQEVSDALKSLRGLAVRAEENAFVPRAFALAVGFLRAVDLIPCETTLSHYFEGIQQVKSLMMAEIWALKPMLEFAILEQIADHSEAFRPQGEIASWEATASSDGSVERVQTAAQALHVIREMDWKDFFEQNSMAERVLRQDPSGAYPNMDDESRQMYRRVEEELARHSLFSEEEVARQAVFLALHSQGRTRNPDSRTGSRRTHVGYYLVAAGIRTLKERIGYKPSLKQRIVDVVFEWPEVFFIVGVELTTIALVFFLLQPLGIIIPFVPGLLLLIPASHAAIGIVNHLTSILMPPRRIPKLDYSEGIPVECMTLVAVPCMLLSEAEVQRNVAALEIRYLGNRTPHLHFALSTDSPDASQPFDEHDKLVGICSALIQQLNQKYAPDQRGGFLHLHRHRIYNPSEGICMGWARKRGKLMDLNSLLLGTFDSFPVKAGDVSVLPHVRYVITLDSDTKLPPGMAQRLTGALAHLLNRAVVDPRTNTVVDGHAILRPRVSVSTESSRHSRLAAIYSG